MSDDMSMDEQRRDVSGTRRPYRTGISRDAIIEAALSLTQEQGLQVWSTRDLTARLDTSLSVLYRRFADRAAIEAAVVEHVIVTVMPPSPATNWRRWISDMLEPAFERLWPYPGVGEWLAFHGPALSSLTPTLETGVQLLRDGGFGDDAPLAYSIAFNTVIGEIALSDQRRTGKPNTPPDRSALVVQLKERATRNTGMMMASYVEQFPGRATEPSQSLKHYFSYLVATVLAGLETQLERRSS